MHGYRHSCATRVNTARSGDVGFELLLETLSMRHVGTSWTPHLNVHIYRTLHEQLMVYQVLLGGRPQRLDYNLTLVDAIDVRGEKPCGPW